MEYLVIDFDKHIDATWIWTEPMELMLGMAHINQEWELGKAKTSESRGVRGHAPLEKFFLHKIYAIRGGILSVLTDSVPVAT